MRDYLENILIKMASNPETVVSSRYSIADELEKLGIATINSEGKTRNMVEVIEDLKKYG